MDDMIRYFYSDGDMNLMLTKVMVYMPAFFWLALILSVLRKMRL